MKNTMPKLQALMAAILFGASAPLAKLLLGNVDPIMLAALLYFGCGLGLFIFSGLQNVIVKHEKKEAGLTINDIPWLAGAILFGGVAAPIVLMISLDKTPAATASLLLNFEGVATCVIATLAFKEALGKRIWTAITFITVASIVLTWNSNGNLGISIGAVGVVLACVFWGMDNNFTRNISAKNPLTIVTIKGIIAGIVSLVIALSTGSSIPNLKVTLAALILGFFSYGISIILFILGMRSLGAARASAFFGSAPFVGTLLSFFIFREWPGANFLLSLPIMIVGAVLILWEDHLHPHKHEMLEHEHRHTHDDSHHQHEHGGKEASDHSHWHIHSEEIHEHPHTPDIHHRHVH
jgi:drug/metabolite transporter (DMT)-like permease